MQTKDIALNYFKEIIINPKSELVYHNSFELLIAVILSAQCTDKRVNIVTKELFKEYNTPAKIVSLGLEGLEDKIKTCGLYKTKAKNIINACQMLVDKYNGQVPSTFEELTSLPGVGRKTANVVLSVAFDKQELAVDTHVFRVSNRIGLVSAKNVVECEQQLKQLYEGENIKDLHHYLVLFGRYYCKAINPMCATCKLNTICKYYRGNK